MPQIKEVRLIDANALPIWGWPQTWEEGAGIQRCIEAIEAAPTIEAEPVRHGRWIDRYFGDKCSECGFEISRTNSVFKSAFCPKCGAKMDAANNLNPLNLPIESGENAADDQDGRWPKRNPYINGGGKDAG